MEREEYVKELKELYELAKKICDVDTAQRLLVELRELGKALK